MNRQLALLAYVTTAAFIAPSASAIPPEMFSPNIVWRDGDTNYPYDQYRDYQFSKGAGDRHSFTVTWRNIRDGKLVTGSLPPGKTNPSAAVYFEDLGDGRIRTNSNEYQVTLDPTGQLNFSRDGKIRFRLRRDPPVAAAVEIEVNSATPNDDYVTWAPTPCRVRLNPSAGRTEPMTVVLTNDTARTGGDVLFAPFQNPWPGQTTATQEELTLTLPADGKWTNFVIAGKFGRASLRDKDAIIDVHEGDASGPVLASHALMVRVRKAAETMTDEEKGRFLTALMALMRRGGTADDYKFYVDSHSDTAAQSGGHNGPVFLPWHRAFLLRFERELQAVDPSVALPYWNWGHQPSAIFNPQFLGTGGSPARFDGLNPIAHWPIIRGEDPNATGRLPDWRRYQAIALNEEKYDRFCYTLELEAHNRGHLWVGGLNQAPGDEIGDMTKGTAPQDPVFFLHHCNIDRIWAQWQRARDRFGKEDQDYPAAHGPSNVMWQGNRPFAASQVAGVWPKEDSDARPVDMIDYLGVHAPAADLGFCYDNLPFGAEAAMEPTTPPAPLVQRNNSSDHMFVMLQAGEQPAWATFANPALADDVRLQACAELTVTDQPGIDELRNIAANRNESDAIRVKAIEMVASSAMMETLLDILDEEADDRLEVKKAAAEGIKVALFAIHSDQRVRIFNVLRKYINDPCPEIRSIALSILVPRNDAQAVKFVKDSLSGKVADSNISTSSAIRLLASDDPRKHLNVIRPFIDDPDDEVLTEAIEAIGFDSESRAAVVRHLQNREQPLHVRQAALRAVEGDRGQAVSLAKQLITDSAESTQLRVAAINSLAGIVSSRVHEMNLRSDQIAAGRAPLSIDDDVPAISAGGRASIHQLLKQTVCADGPPEVAAEAFRVAHWLQQNDPALRQPRPQRPAARVPNQVPQPVPNQPQFVPNTVPQPVPSQPRFVPNQPQIVPNQPRIVPNQVPQPVPSQPRFVPNQPRFVPNQVPQPVPNQPQFVPNQPQFVPNQPQFVPNQPQFVPNQPQFLPNQVPQPQMEPRGEGFNPGGLLDLIPQPGQQPHQSEMGPGGEGFNPGGLFDLIPQPGQQQHREPEMREEGGIIRGEDFNTRS